MTGGLVEKAKVVCAAKLAKLANDRLTLRSSSCEPRLGANQLDGHPRYLTGTRHFRTCRHTCPGILVGR